MSHGGHDSALLLDLRSDFSFPRPGGLGPDRIPLCSSFQCLRKEAGDSIEPRGLSRGQCGPQSSRRLRERSLQMAFLLDGWERCRKGVALGREPESVLASATGLLGVLGQVSLPL